MGLISARVKIEVAIPVSCMRGVGGRTPGIAVEVWRRFSLPCSVEGIGDSCASVGSKMRLEG